MVLTARASAILAQMADKRQYASESMAIVAPALHELSGGVLPDFRSGSHRTSRARLAGTSNAHETSPASRSVHRNVIRHLP